MPITAATLKTSRSTSPDKLAPYIELRITDRVGLDPYDGWTDAERENVLTAALSAAIAALPMRFTQASGELVTETAAEVAHR
ncbi:hypothetical protein [Streptomyces sp. cg36]|uniref:hypothetical protein n=1 Tax=Streptomyces sp. cg36 TaxID=3238798 RepID=UPI0034E232AE